jgi:hypothetical protein
VFGLFLVVGHPFRPDQFVKPCPGNRKILKSILAASEGGHTLGGRDLGMILAWRGNGVSDGGHSAGVMKRDGQSGEDRDSSPLKPKAGLNGPPPIRR